MYSELTILVLTGKSTETQDGQDIARILADHFRVVEAESLEECISQISNGVNAIVADLDSNALELLQRAKPRHPAIPILVLTNHGNVGAAVEAMKLGADDCMVKPVQPDELRGKLSELIENSRGGDPPGGNSNRPNDPTQIEIPPGTSLEELERAAVEQALAQHAGNRTHAAKTLGISVRTLQRKLKAWGIPLVSSPPTARSGSSSQSNNFILPGPGSHSAYSAHAHSAR